MPTRYKRIGVPLAVFLLVLGGSSCNFGNEGIFSVGGLEVVPNPAREGDVVTFVFNLVVVPERNFTVTTRVDGTVRTTETFQSVQDGRFEVVVGNATDLIAEFGLGPHAADVTVTFNQTNDVIRAQTVGFDLEEALPASGAEAGS